MADTYEATPWNRPVFNAVEVGDRGMELSTNPCTPLTITQLSTLLSERGKREHKPGWVQTPSTLYRRIAAINAPIKHFQWYPGHPLSAYQVWVVIRIHENLFILTPAKQTELIQVLKSTESTYSPEKFEQWKEAL